MNNQLYVLQVVTIEDEVEEVVAAVVDDNILMVEVMVITIKAEAEDRAVIILVVKIEEEVMEMQAIILAVGREEEVVTIKYRAGVVVVIILVLGEEVIISIKTAVDLTINSVEVGVEEEEAEMLRHQPPFKNPQIQSSRKSKTSCISDHLQRNREEKKELQYISTVIISQCSLNIKLLITTTSP